VYRLGSALRRGKPYTNPVNEEALIMLRWAVIFLVVALVAAVLGFGGIAGAAAGIAKFLFFLFLVLFVLALIFGRRVLSA
jgi:uncharacterized membrane protein YtjA (UPF0391 family)